MYFYRFRTFNNRIDITAISVVIVYKFNGWVKVRVLCSVWHVWAYLVEQSFPIHRRHKSLTCKRVFDKVYISTTKNTLVDRQWAYGRRIVVDGVFPCLVTIPLYLRIAKRNIILATISNNTCYDFVVLWCARIILQSNTLSKAEYIRLALVIKYFVWWCAKQYQESLTLCITCISRCNLVYNKRYFPRFIGCL